jgi:hypothetical protein
MYGPVYLFIAFGLSNDTISNSDNITLNRVMISE